MAGGRPTKFKPEFIESARRMAETGATDREIAHMLDVDEATIHRWKHDHEGFCESLRVGKEKADERVIQSLYRRALGYQHDAVKISVSSDGGVTQVPYVEQFPPDTTAAIFWLKNRRPDDWRDKVHQELSASDSFADAMAAAMKRAGR